MAQSKKSGLFMKVKSLNILKKIFNILSQKKSLKIIAYNKNIQKKLNKDIEDYKEYLRIEIDIIPKPNIYGQFINVEKIEPYYHIYFNDNKKEIKQNTIPFNGITKIKIKIDYEIKTLSKLFTNCKCIKK